MKQLLTAIIAVFTAASLNAQITIDSSDFGVAGDSLVVGNYVPTSAISVGGTGSQNWTFTFLVDDINTLKFQFPANTNRAALFPNADIAMERQSDTLFFKKTAAEFTLDGLSGDVSGITGIPLALGLNIDGDVEQIRFPATLNSSFTDQAVVDTIVDCASVGAGSFCEQARVKRRYLITSDIDAHGPLETSGGSYPNTIRQYYIERTIDSVWANLPFIGGPLNFIQEVDSTNHIYRWFAKEEDWPVLTAYADGQGGDMVSVEFQVDTLLAYISSSSNPSCNGDCDATATIEPIGDTGPYDFAWPASAGSQSTATGTGLCAGTHTVTISDAALNTTTIDVVLQDPTAVAVTGSIQGVSTSNNGAIDITASGGTGTYTYAWTGPEGYTATTADISGLAEGEYTVVVTDGNGCTATQSYLVELTGVEAINTSNIKMYPNPANEFLTLTSDTQIDKITFIDMIGNIVSVAAPNSNKAEINTSELSAGIYMLEITTTDGKAFKKLTIKH
ncbi:MAG: hypothetical protein Salg2KO_00340 [Salibacteraceae bacterium]